MDAKIGPHANQPVLLMCCSHYLSQKSIKWLIFMTDDDITSDVCKEFNLLKAKIKGNIWKIYD
ncbi:hypothetical protein BpHYR1_034840 [Brachionus plicatilis]|uniref:Uncharacterized protein n=1 Tax=Brachionus plicatilis TaxID=10195 RepID=A0A3M7TA64_BRAPC|nr:hypothetical protein BpHYR1_034840 [Brachionus plicatilis]